MLFTERDAILFEMNELKEQGRLDCDMYFELRKHRNQRYNELQDRLRIIDEREGIKEIPVAPPVPQIIVQKPTVHPERKTLRELFKELPPARSSHMTQSEMRADRIKVEEEVQPQKHTNAYASVVETTEAIENYLKTQVVRVPLKKVQQGVEKILNKHWANFSDVMRRALDLSPYIKVDETNHRKLYFYKED